MVLSPNLFLRAIALISLTKMPRPGSRASPFPLIEQYLQVAELLSDLLQTEARKLGLTFTQARVLACLHAFGGDPDVVPTATWISGQIGHAKSNVSTALTTLSGLQLLTKKRVSGGDGRLSELHLTAKGLVAAESLARGMLSAETYIRDKMRVRRGSTNLAGLTTELRKLSR